MLEPPQKPGRFRTAATGSITPPVTDQTVMEIVDEIFGDWAGQVSHNGPEPRQHWRSGQKNPNR